jgi:hypothetical protein
VKRRWRKLDRFLADQIIVVAEERVRPSPLNIELVELTSNQCRWPMDGTIFCGAEIEDALHERHNPSYCKGHAQIAYASRIIKEPD